MGIFLNASAKINVLFYFSFSTATMSFWESLPWLKATRKFWGSSPWVMATREREREREGFYPPFVAQPQYYGFFLFFSLSSGKLSQWTTMTKESSFVAVIHYDEGKFIRHSGPVQQRKNPLSCWIPVTKKNSNVTMSHCDKGILFVAVNQCNEGKLLCNSEPLWQKNFFFVMVNHSNKGKFQIKATCATKWG